MSLASRMAGSAGRATLALAKPGAIGAVSFATKTTSTLPASIDNGTIYPVHFWHTTSFSASQSPVFARDRLMYQAFEGFRTFGSSGSGQPGTAASGATVAPDADTSKLSGEMSGQAVPEKHPGSPNQWENKETYLLMHPVYTKDYVESIKPKHKKPVKMHEYVAYYGIQTVRSLFDLATNYGHDKMNKDKWMTRTIFLETIAGVPGMVAGMLRHMKSLRSMRRDNGWIHTLLEEAENERMHLLTFLQIKEPGFFFRTFVLFGQGVFFNMYFLLYILAPKTCHAAVGYLEEEAVKTYTHLIEDIENNRVPEWADKPAPEIARMYWRLGENASFRDMFLAIRADEACHSYVNHTFSEMDQHNDKNPFSVGSHTVP